MEFSKPRLVHETDDYPSGGIRVKCIFKVESHRTRGYRVSRTTTNKFGAWCKPKYSTYSTLCAIVTGEDGQTYILQYNKYAEAVFIYDHAFITSRDLPLCSKDSDPERYNHLLTLINRAHD